MSILKNKTNRENFLIVSKIFLQDKNLSIAERGLLATMHSLPNNWEFSVSGMTKILPDGKSKIGTALDGLIKKGYIIKKQSKTSARSTIIKLKVFLELALVSRDLSLRTVRN